MRRQVNEDQSGLGKLVWAGMLVLCLILASFEIFESVRQRVWDGVNRMTVITFKNGEMVIRSAEPGNLNAVELILPGELKVTTIGHGVWVVKSLPELSRKYGDKWMVESLSGFLGIPISGTLDKMGIWDRLSWLWLSYGKLWQQLDMRGSNLAVKTVDIDGEETMGLSSMWQKVASDTFYSSKIASVGWKLSVYNTTTAEGLAAKLARIAETQGFKVVNLSYLAEEVQQCVVLSNLEQMKSVEIEWLKKYFTCDWKEDDNLATDEAGLWVGRNYTRWVE